MNIDELGVLLFAYCRPDMLANRIKELEGMKITNLYISIDGGPKSHTLEMDNVKLLAQQILTNVKNLKIIHYKENLGMVRHFNKAVSSIFDKHEYLAFVEEDIILSKNYIKNMVRGFNEQLKYKKLGFVSSWSPFYSKSLPNVWRDSSYPYVWGIGFSRRIWQLYDKDFSTIDIESSLAKSIIWNNLNDFQKQYWIKKFEKIKSNPKITYDYQLNYLAFRYDFRNICPLFTLVGNEGFGSPLSTNTTSRKPKFVTINKINNKLIRNKISLTKFFKHLDNSIVVGDSKLFWLIHKFKLKQMVMLNLVSDIVLCRPLRLGNKNKNG